MQSSTAPVDAAGGAVSDSSGDALTIPPGDFTAETTIEVEEGAHLVEPGCTECGEPVVFGPIGTTLLHPATLTIHYDDAEFPEGETVAHLVVWEDDGTGQPVELHPIAVDEIEHVVTIETEVLGTFECEIDPTFAVTTSTILVDSVDEVIDANGGTLVNAEGDAIVIPAGDFTDAIDVAIAPGSHLVEAGCTECGSPVAFGVAGTQLAQAATITVAYDELLVPAGETVSHLVVFEDDGQGNVTELHATSVDETHHTISVETTVLGTFEVELDPNAN